jgi:hypothetical protein
MARVFHASLDNLDVVLPAPRQNSGNEENAYEWPCGCRAIGTAPAKLEVTMCALHDEIFEGLGAMDEADATTG